MSVYITFFPGIYMAPGSSAAYLIIRYFDYLRGECHILSRDTYFRYKVQEDYSSSTCDLDLSSISSGTLRMLRGCLVASVTSRSLGSFDHDFTFITYDAFLEKISESIYKIDTALELRNQMISHMNHGALVALAAKTIFLRAFWRDVLEPAYERAFPTRQMMEYFSKGELRYSEAIEMCQHKGRSEMMQAGYKWLKINGLSLKIYNDLMF